MKWKDRQECITRIGTLEMNFLPKDGKDARGVWIAEAVRTVDGDTFKYCDDPTSMTDKQIIQLRVDVELWIEKKRRVEAIQHLAWKALPQVKKLLKQKA
jgi:hypothetical protein